MTNVECRVLWWVSHPLTDDSPLKAALLVVIILGLSAGVYLSFGGIVYAGITALTLFISLSRYFLPVRYELTDSGVQIQHLGFRRQMLWIACRNLYVHPEGVYLSPLERPGRLDPFRGCFLRFKGNGEEVLAFVRGKIMNRQDMNRQDREGRRSCESSGRWKSAKN